MREMRWMKSLAVLCAAFLLQGCEGNEITEREKALLLTVADLAPYIKGNFDPSRAKIKKTYNPVVNSKEISYLFEFKESAGEPPLFLSYTVTMEPKLVHGYNKATHDAGTAIGFAIGKLKQVPQQDFPKYGDRSSFNLLTMEDRPVGNLFDVEYGRKSATLIISGMYVRNPAVWQEMVGEKLRLLESYEEEKKD